MSGSDVMVDINRGGKSADVVDINNARGRRVRLPLKEGNISEDEIRLRESSGESTMDETTQYYIDARLNEKIGDLRTEMATLGGHIQRIADGQTRLHEDMATFRQDLKAGLSGFDTQIKEGISGLDKEVRSYRSLIITNGIAIGAVLAALIVGFFAFGAQMIEMATGLFAAGVGAN